MNRNKGNRALHQAVALSQVLLLVVAGCKSSPDKETKASVVSQSLVGKDDALTVTDPNTIVNAYAALAADVAVSAPSVTVASGGLPGLAAGDLVLIIQMAGATINEPGDPNDASYGAVAALGSSGNYELAGVASVSGSTITLGCGLQKAYTVAGKTQVIRVPQYSTLTVNSGASIIAPAWNGTVGGVVALQATTTLDLNGTIDASATGFRGGVVHQGMNFTTDSDQTSYRSADPNEGAEKGESIAGWPHDPNTFAFPFGRGAPANGGGGGNWHNAGGGGGANAAASGVGSDGGGANWTGQGVMSSSVVGAAAWSLDPGYALSGGPGGGRGGYTYSANNNPDQNALTEGPGNANWNGNRRRERGGLGGRPLTSSPGGRLFLGGGGGAGDGNNGFLAPGGEGGGLVFVIAGTVTGAGSILANGAPGDASNSTTTSGDAPGGGGGGGTVVVHAGTLGQNIVVRANGGVGGSQHIANTNEAEGPGGGGGGGYIALSGGVPSTVTADGGDGGATDSPGLTEFPPNGATSGQAGRIEDTAASSMLYCTNPSVTIASKPSDPTDVGAGTFAFTSPQSAITFECSLDGATYATCPASYTTADLADGSHTLDVRVRDLNGNLGTSTATWTWHVLHAGDLDAGVDAEPENPDAVALLDVAALDSPPVSQDAGMLDSGEGIDAVALLDAGEDGGTEDGPGTVVLHDAAAGADVRADVAGKVDGAPSVKLDAPAGGADTRDAEDVSGDGNELEAGAEDAQPLDSSGGDGNANSDLPTPPPVTQMDAGANPAVDAAVPGSDAAVLPDLKLMGSGFCAVSPMHDHVPGLFTLFLVAAFGLLLVRRRR